MKTKLLLTVIALFIFIGIHKAQCTKTQTAQTVFSTPGAYTVGLSGVGPYIQICPNVLIYDTLGSNQRQYYLLPGAQLVLKNCFSQFVYMQGNSSVTRYGSGGNSTTVYYETTATVNGTTMVSSTTCAAVSFPTVSCSASGIKEHLQADLLSLYPNPANDHVVINNDHLTSLTGIIANSIGKTERVITILPGKNTIDLYGLNEGVYTINVINNGQAIARGKIMVIK
jgi:hypothetical protein